MSASTNNRVIVKWKPWAPNGIDLDLEWDGCPHILSGDYYTQYNIIRCCDWNVNFRVGGERPLTVEIVREGKILHSMKHNNRCSKFCFTLKSVNFSDSGVYTFSFIHDYLGKAKMDIQLNVLEETDSRQ